MKVKILLIIIATLIIAGCTQEVKQMGELKLTSTAFKDQENIPPKYTCQGDNTNPELTISGIPERTKTLALILDDPDAPSGTFNHWTIFNIQPTEKIAESSAPQESTQGKNSAGKNSYTGPCPPSGTHRYIFNLYALDTELTLDATATSKDLRKAMEEHILAQTTLTGLYQKK